MFLYNDQSPVTFNDSIPEAVDVVIIGGGVIGISTAWFLRARGISVLVCDKGRIAGEQSSRNWGWARAMERDPHEVPIAMQSIDIWEQLALELGEGIGFRRGGIASFAASEQKLAKLEQWLPVAREYGLNTRLVSSTEANELIGAPDGRWKGAIYTPTDGRAEPFTAVKTIAGGLQASGGLLREACAVRTIDQAAGRVCGVCTEAGYVKTQTVVCAGGVWSSLFLSNMGIPLPQLAVKATVARTVTAPEIFNGAAALGDVYIRRRQDGGYTVACDLVDHHVGPNSFRYLTRYIPAMLGGNLIRLRLRSDPTQRGLLAGNWSGEDATVFEDHRVLNLNPSARALRIMRRNLDKRVPGLRGIEFAESWAGVIDTMPDVVPVMDKIDAVPGLFLATGFSGHGFGFGPGAGKVMAKMVAGDRPEHDLSRFRFGRFSDGSKIRPGPAL